jgi:hypothetical protein
MEPVNEFVQEAPVAEVGALELYLMSEKPAKIISDTCGLCKKTWESTPDVVTTTLLCGHTYHTICQALHEYEDDTFKNCPDEMCEYSGHRIIRDISRKRRQIEDDKVDEIVKENVQKPSFTKDIKLMRTSIRAVTLAHGDVHRAFRNFKKELVHKHIHTINQIQSEMNAGLANIRNGEEVKKYKSSLSAYRKMAAFIFRNYHMSFRDLQNMKIIDVAWRVRWILERYRGGTTSWRYAIRISPGKKLWKDPIQDDEV